MLNINLFYISLSFSILSCSTRVHESPQKQINELEKYIIINYSDEVSWAFETNKPYLKENLNAVDSFSTEMLKKLNVILREKVDIYNLEEVPLEVARQKEIYKKFNSEPPKDFENDLKVDFEKYHNKCLPIEYKNEIYIFILGIHENIFNPSEKFILNDIDGGGNFVFRSIINLDTGEVFYFSINSPI